MSEISSTRRNNQDELAELQSEHARKRKKLVNEQHEEIDELKQDHQVRKEKLGEQQEAAINHIRKDQTRNVERAQEQRAKAQQKAVDAVQKIETTYSKKIADMRGNRERVISEAEAKADQQVRLTQERQQERMDKLRVEADTQYERTKNESNTRINDLAQKHRARMESFRAQVQDEQNRELTKGREHVGKVRAENQENLERTLKEGEQSIAERKQIEERKHARLESEFERKYDGQRKTWQDRERNLDSEYGNKLSRNKERYDEQTKLQKKRFDSLYAKNEEANRRSFQIQSDNAEKELNALKRDFLSTAMKYQGKENDPFYKVQDRGSRMSESRNFFVIDAYAPAHEKDSVKITVEKDKATVQGQRAFKDKFTSEEDAKKVATSTFQSFREEFTFDKPVIAEGMTRERSGDWVRIMVPKLNTFSRKA